MLIGDLNTNTRAFTLTVTQVTACLQRTRMMGEDGALVVLRPFDAKAAILNSILTIKAEFVALLISVYTSTTHKTGFDYSPNLTLILMSASFPPTALLLTYVQTAGVFGLAAAHLLLPPSVVASIPPFPALDRLLHPTTVSNASLPSFNDDSLAQMQHVAGIALLGIGCGYAFSLWVRLPIFPHVKVSLL